MPTSSTIIVASSLPAAGASNVSNDGSEFDIELASALSFPAGSNPRVCVAEAGVWFSFPNVITGSNDTLYYTDDVGTPYKWPIVLEQGLYSLDSINQKLAIAFASRSHETTAFEFVGDDATGRVFLVKQTTVTALQFNFGSQSPNADLGFATNYRFPNAPQTAAATVLAPNQAALDRVTTVMVHCSLAAGQSLVGPNSGAALASFTPGDAAVGQLINYRPPFQQWVSLPRMAGQSIQRFHLWLTDQSGRRGSLNTGGEPWSVSLCLEW